MAGVEWVLLCGNNIVYFDQGRLLGSNRTGDGFKMDRNVYWDVRLKVGFKPIDLSTVGRRVILGEPPRPAAAKPTRRLKRQ